MWFCRFLYASSETKVGRTPPGLAPHWFQGARARGAAEGRAQKQAPLKKHVGELMRLAWRRANVSVCLLGGLDAETGYRVQSILARERSCAERRERKSSLPR